jgi:RNA-directed DNA polymerase
VRCSGIWRADPWRLRIVHDPKTRLIAAPSIRDRVVHRALLDEIGPHYERGFLEQAYAWGSGRGPHRAVLQLLAWMRRYRYRLGLDIARYFPSIRHPTLSALLFHRLGDPKTRTLVLRLLAAGARVYRTALAGDLLGFGGPDWPGERGLALGSYWSQWCGNFYLDGLDHYIKRELKVPAYLRYMDDLVLLDDERSRLEEARAAIREWVGRERGLALNPKRGHVVPGREPVVFLGYRVSPAGTAPSRKLRRRMARRLRHAARKGPDALRRTLASYRGLLLF